MVDEDSSLLLPKAAFQPTDIPRTTTLSASDDDADEISMARQEEEQTWMTMDSVHGVIRLPVLIKQFIDHPIFQRLRQIKQLALCEFVYIGANHTRFAHSVGTCHLAYELVSKVRSRNPSRCSLVDLHCICLAALLHDLGHPCFSHMFEKFMQESGGNPHWEHEEASLKLCDAIFEDKKEVGMCR